MRRFIDLLNTLAGIGEPHAQEEAIVAFLRTLPSAGGVQVLCLLAGVRPRRCATGRDLLLLAAERGGLPFWLVDLSARTAGETPEAVALLLGPTAVRRTRSLEEAIRLLVGLRRNEGAARREALGEILLELPVDERVLLCRLATGTFRPKVPRTTVLPLLARQTGLTEGEVAHRLYTLRHTAVEDVDRLLAHEIDGDGPGPPYAFTPITAYRGEPHDLGDPSAWIIIGCARGRRCQIVRRDGEAAVWTGELECVSRNHPGILRAAGAMPDGTVVDGFLVTDPDAEGFVGFDVLEHEGRDIRGLRQEVRYDRLAEVLRPGQALLRCAERLFCRTPEEVRLLLRKARGRGYSGLLIGTGQVGAAAVAPPGWLILRGDPLLLDAVLLYVEPGGGWTFGVRDGDRWLPVATVGPRPGESHEDEVDDFVRKHAVQRFGPVRALPPLMVFTLAFDEVRRAPRRRAGFTLVNPALLARKRNVPASSAATLEDLCRLHDSRVDETGAA